MSGAWRDRGSDDPAGGVNLESPGPEERGGALSLGWRDDLSVAFGDDSDVSGEDGETAPGFGPEDLEALDADEEPYAPPIMKIPVPVVAPAGRKLLGITIPDSCMVYRVACDPGAVSVGDRLLVQVADGEVVATIRHIFELPSEPYPGPIRRVVRRLNDKDLRFLDGRAEQELKAQRICRERIRELKLPMKLSKVVYPLGGNKAIIHFTSEERIDFRDLVRLLSADLRVRVEMRHVGVRDESKLLCGLGPCGKMLCCGQFLTRFHPVSVRMAKNQDLSLTPEGISGVCGRLMCCLAYENDVYLALRKNLPKLKSKVTLKDGREGVVRGLFPLVNRVEIWFGEGVIETMDLDKLAGEYVGTVNPDADEGGDATAEDETSRAPVPSTGLSRGKRGVPMRCPRQESGNRGEIRANGSASGGAIRDGAGQSGEKRGERAENRSAERPMERSRVRKRPVEVAEVEVVTRPVVEATTETGETGEIGEGGRKRPSRRRRRGGKGSGVGGEAGSQVGSEMAENGAIGEPVVSGGAVGGSARGGEDGGAVGGSARGGEDGGAVGGSATRGGEDGGDAGGSARWGEDGGDEAGEEESTQAEPGRPARRRRRRRRGPGVRREGSGSDGAASPATGGES
ncbi:hypothetical protein SIID45300_01572 [Candidatus Magnetaquicoccaceae bacterium FCR-1]|uniref:PSP1 C-terminal domain-containing protein n=1 Tax=Candidatus Magnetaquiglobus chichijimensis TaxID=3141448 RepID=A0ABQ0C8P8_9PROT